MDIDDIEEQSSDELDEIDLLTVDPTGLGLNGIDVSDLGTFTQAELSAAFPEIVDLFEDPEPATPDEGIEALRSLVARGALVLEPVGSDEEGDDSEPVLRVGTALGIIDLHRRHADRIGLVHRRHPLGTVDLAVYRYGQYDDGRPTFVIEIAGGPFRRYLVTDLDATVAAVCRLLGLAAEDVEVADGPTFDIDLAAEPDRDNKVEAAFRAAVEMPLDLVVLSVDHVPNTGPVDLTVVHGEDASWAAESPDASSTRCTVAPLQPSTAADWLRNRLA